MDDASNGDAKKHVLGEGSSGFTTRQKWRGSIVAVKRVNVSTPTRVATFLREVDVLRRLRHPHVLPFYGAGLDPVDRRGGCFILTRVCEGGTMKQWLYPQSSNGGPGNAGARTMNSGPSGKEQPPLSRRLALAWDVARGMAYLESRGVMHRDLKPGNVFVTDSGSSGRAVIADFGLAREVDPEAVLTGETGTYLYMAPEVIRHERTYGSPADAWSFGVTLGELVRGAPPYPTELFEKRLSPTQIAIGVADGLMKPALMNGGGCHPGVAAIAAACTEFDPGDRPTFRRVVQELDAMLPEVHGFDICRRIKGSKRYGHIPVIMVSAIALVISSSRRLWSMGVVTAEVASRSGGSSTAQVSRSIGGGDMAATPASLRTREWRRRWTRKTTTTRGRAMWHPTSSSMSPACVAVRVSSLVCLRPYLNAWCV